MNGKSPVHSPYSAPISGESVGVSKNGVYLSTRAAHKRKTKSGPVVGSLSPPNTKENELKPPSAAQIGVKTHSAPLTAALPRSGSSMPHLDLSHSSMSSTRSIQSSSVDLTEAESDLPSPVSPVSSSSGSSQSGKNNDLSGGSSGAAPFAIKSSKSSVTPPSSSSSSSAMSPGNTLNVSPNISPNVSPHKDSRRRLTRKKGYTPTKRVIACPIGNSSSSSAHVSNKLVKDEKIDVKSPQLASSGSSVCLTPDSPSKRVSLSPSTNAGNSLSSASPSKLRRNPLRSRKQTLKGKESAESQKKGGKNEVEIVVIDDSDSSPESTPDGGEEEREGEGDGGGENEGSDLGSETSVEIVSNSEEKVEKVEMNIEIENENESKMSPNGDAAAENNAVDAADDGDADDMEMWDVEDEERISVPVGGKEDIIDES